MEQIIDFFIQTNQSLRALNIDLLLVILVICGGAFQYRYLSNWKLSATTKTLIIATIFTILYIPLTCNFASFESAKPCLLMGLISYCVATSFYEVILKKVMTYLTTKKDVN